MESIFSSIPNHLTVAVKMNALPIHFIAQPGFESESEKCFRACSNEQFIRKQYEKPGHPSD